MSSIETNIKALKNMHLLKFKLKEVDLDLIVKIEPVTFYFIFKSNMLYNENSVILDSVSTDLFLSSVGIKKSYLKVIFKKIAF